MADSEYSLDNYKSSKISIGAIIKNSDLFLMTLKLKRSVKKAYENSVPNSLIKYVSNRFKIQEMCHKVIQMCHIIFCDAT